MSSFSIFKKLNIYSLKFNIWFFVCIFLLSLLLLVLTVYLVVTGIFYNDIIQADLQGRTASFILNCEEDYSTAINKSALPDDVNAAVFDRAGQSLAETGDFYKTQYFSKYRSEVMKSDEMLFVRVPENNHELFICAKRVEFSDGNVGCVYLSTAVYSDSLQLRLLRVVLVVVLTIVFIFAVFIAMLLSRYITAPIVKITDSVKQLTKGDYNVIFESTGYTEIDKLACSLTMTAQQLKETDNLKTELIANVSHDLKTPLTLIKSYAEMIRDLSGDHKIKRNEHLEVIIGETDRLTTLVNDLVKLSKLQSQKQEMEYTEFNISETLKRVLKSFEIMKDYNFVTEIEEDIEVLADENRISQVLNNLIGNAVNYTGEDKYVKVTLRSIGNRVRIDVYDHGEGIPEDELEKIWDRYYRSKKTHTREVIGSGLGLSIVKNILMAHNAEYGVESTLGEGSNFYFILEK